MESTSLSLEPFPPSFALQSPPFIAFLLMTSHPTKLSPYIVTRHDFTQRSIGRNNSAVFHRHAASCVGHIRKTISSEQEDAHHRMSEQEDQVVEHSRTSSATPPPAQFLRQMVVFPAHSSTRCFYPSAHHICYRKPRRMISSTDKIHLAPVVIRYGNSYSN